MSVVDYKNTLNLPHTDFPMRGNLAQKEPLILEKWQSLNLYERLQNQPNQSIEFNLHSGPPYANGSAHMGHALNIILKDIITKSKLLSGCKAPFVPGWDCHGLPIELNVEKKLGSKAITPAEFRKACAEYAKTQIDIQKAVFVRLGVLADWQNPYLTMDYKYQADTVRSLAKIVANGYLQKGAKPVHWCLKCRSALAEAEVEYQNKKSPAIDVAFKVVHPKEFLTKINQSQLNLDKIHFIVWTTTPWTLPANQAVALHPDLEYCLVRTTEREETLGTWCVVKEQLQNCIERFQCSQPEILAFFKGSQVKNILLQHPFYVRQVPIILGEHVTTEAGTGAVHTAPAHGLEDYTAGLKYKLSVDNPVDEAGRFKDNVPLLEGIDIFQGNDLIIKILDDHHHLVHVETLDHSYPHCWRHKTPVIFRATPQWFISMETNHLRAQTLEAINKVNWIPKTGFARISSMIEGRPDWCISRQRTWGVPLVLLTHQQTESLHPDMVAIMNHVAHLIEKEGIEAWHSLNLSDLPFKDMEHYIKAKDILDVWFDSGVSHEAVLQRRAELNFPADLYLEGSDQHRGWFQTSLISSMSMNHEAPFKNVLTHGFVVDAHGKKMSKSLGNVVDPEKVIKNLGADVLRLWVAATDYKGDIHVSDEILNRMSDAYRRIRNTIRFLLANLHGFNPEKDLVEPAKLLALDAWIIDCVANLQNEVIQAYDNYQFHSIYQKIHNFCVVELGGFYLDIIKDRQYTTSTNSLPRRSAQTALYYIAHSLVRLLAPILSFTSEEIWQHLPGMNTDSIFLTRWLENIPRINNQTYNDELWQMLMLVKTEVNKVLEAKRIEGKIGAPLQAEVTLYASGKTHDFLQRLGEELRFILITSSAKVDVWNNKSHDAIMSGIPELAIEVKVSENTKCARCWHHRSDVDQYPQFPGICRRCVSNIDPNQTGEVRQYA